MGTMARILTESKATHPVNDRESSVRGIMGRESQAVECEYRAGSCVRIRVLSVTVSRREDTTGFCLAERKALINHPTDVRNVTLILLSALLDLPVPSLLQSKRSAQYKIRDDILRLDSAASSKDFDFDHIIPLLEAALADNLEDALIWDRVADAAAALNVTPPPGLTPLPVQQTPRVHSTGGIVSSSERRSDIDPVLKRELGQLRVELPSFHATFFGRVAGLERAAAAVFQSCTSGSDPLFQEGWMGWPTDANEGAVIGWFKDVTAKLVAFADGRRPPQTQRWLLAQPNTPLQGSTVKRKLDIGFVRGPKPEEGSPYLWSQVLVPGELKNNPSADTHAKAWLDLGRYVRETLSAQDTRRFVLGFTLCGSMMRIWEFDRLGGIASDKFDINKEGERFVSTILGFLWMSEEDLGFDPTIITSCGEVLCDE
nr:hypothetical protein L203_06310 [Cryptococcus depauperatus CBS 7841]